MKTFMQLAIRLELTSAETAKQITIHSQGAKPFRTLGRYRKYREMRDLSHQVAERA